MAISRAPSLCVTPTFSCITSTRVGPTFAFDSRRHAVVDYNEDDNYDEAEVQDEAPPVPWRSPSATHSSRLAATAFTSKSRRASPNCSDTGCLPPFHVASVAQPRRTPSLSHRVDGDGEEEEDPRQRRGT